jgi:hypothetical protein
LGQSIGTSVDQFTLKRIFKVRLLAGKGRQAVGRLRPQAISRNLLDDY